MKYKSARQNTDSDQRFATILTVTRNIDETLGEQYVLFPDKTWVERSHLELSELSAHDANRLVEFIQHLEDIVSLYDVSISTLDDKENAKEIEALESVVQSLYLRFFVT